MATAETDTRAVDTRRDERAPVVVVAAALALMLAPNLTLPGYTTYDSQRVLQVAVVVVTALALAALPRLRADVGRRVAGASRVWAAAGLAVALGLVSSALAPSPTTGLLEVGLLAGSVVVGLTVAAESRRAPIGVATVVTVAVAAGVLLQLVPLLVEREVSSGTGLLWAVGGVNGGFAHPRFLNQFQALALPSLSLLATSDRPVPRWSGRLLVLVTAWSMATTGARGAGAAVVAATVVVALALGRPGRRWAVALVPPGLVGVALAIVTRSGLTAGGPGGARPLTTMSGRGTIWRDALERIGDAPLLGVGPGHLAHVAVLPPYDLSVPAHPHDAPLQLAAEWGVPAALLVVGVLAIGGLWLVRGKPIGADRVDRLGVDLPVVRAGAVAGLGTGLALSLVSGVLVTPVALLLLAVTAGMAFGTTAAAGGVAGAEVETATAATRAAAGGWVVVLVAVAASGVLVAEVATKPASTLAADRAAYEADGPPGVDVQFEPRFWVHGLRGIGP